MASSYSQNLAIELIGTGDQAGTWGVTTNTNLGTLIEQAISGYVTQAVSTGGDTTITIPNGATGVARNMYIELTGTGGASTNLIVPSNKKLYFIFNNTASGQVTVKVAGQTGVSVPNGAKMILVSNGTDIVDATNFVGTLSATSLTVSSGSTLNGGVVVNEPGADVDFRVESDTNDHAFFVNGANGNIGIGIENTSNTKLYVDSGSVSQYGRFNSTAANGGYASFESSGTAHGDIGTAAQIVNGGANTDFGINARGSRNLIFGTNNEERARIDASGNFIFNEVGADVDFRVEGDTDANLLFVDASTDRVGFGTNTPTHKVQISGASPQLSISGTAGGGNRGLVLIDNNGTKFNFFVGAQNNVNNAFEITPSTAAGGTTFSTPALVVDSSGNLLVGQTNGGFNSAGLPLVVGSGSGNTGITIFSGSASAGSLHFADAATTGNDSFRGYINYNHSTNSMQFGTDAAERARISSAGDVLFGTTSLPSAGSGGSAFRADTQGRRNLYLSTQSTGNNGLVYFLNPNGEVGSITTNGSATSYNTSSDARLKENITDSEDAGNKIDSIQVRQFYWKADGTHQNYGMVAQELMTVAPEAVSGDPESDEMMGVDYSKLVPMLVKEVQSLRKRVAELESK